MTSTLMINLPVALDACPGWLVAAGIVRDAAEVLADEACNASETARYAFVAQRMALAIRSPRIGREVFIQISPALTERSGRSRSLVEMIEDDPGDYDARLRLAKLLFRALVWHPETFPMPPVPLVAVAWPR